MRLVYFSHSYRKEDAPVVRYFGELIRTEGLLPVLDPPSESVNAARLQRHLRDSDGMVVVLTRRDTGVSPHILFEAALCLQARKPLLVFVEDVLTVERIPSRVLRSRFSRKWFFRQVRDHRQAVRLFKSYLGEDPPPRYQPPSDRQTCLAIGISSLSAPVQQGVHDAIEQFGYSLVSDQLSDRVQEQSIRLSEHLACADLAVEVIDSPKASDHFLMGAVRATFIPRISLTGDPRFEFDGNVPLEYQPRVVSSEDVANTQAVLAGQFGLYEQAFVELETPEEVSRYVDLLLRASNPVGEYSKGTRNLFIQELTVGDQYKVGQAGAVGPNSHAHDITFQQVWNEAAEKLDLETLASELAQLRPALKQASTSAEEDMAVGEVAMAEVAAKQKDGPKALAHLKNAGKWALGVAEKIGVGVATAAIKSAMEP
jgi:hypothetical protein